MERKTTVEISKEELAEIVMKHAENGEIKVKVPRKNADGDTVSELHAIVVIGAEVFQNSLAAALEIGTDELEGMDMSVKREGGITLTY